MREIKFRAFSEKLEVSIYPNERWHYGYYLTNEWDEPTICNGDGAWKIILETLGQFTGLLDKNEKPIYEGDILATWNNKDLTLNEIKEYFGFYIVKWSEFGGRFQLERTKKTWEDNYCDCSFDEIKDRRLEVIGNIHKNPELLTN